MTLNAFVKSLEAVVTVVVEFGDHMKSSFVSLSMFVDESMNPESDG